MQVVAADVLVAGFAFSQILGQDGSVFVQQSIDVFLRSGGQGNQAQGQGGKLQKTAFFFMAHFSF